MSLQLFRKSISKSSEGLLLYNGNSISGMVGNAEMGFFSVGHTVYRYHVKSKVIDKLFTEERMESFYPISSHVILWKRAEENKNKATLMDKKNAGAGVYFSYDIRDGKSQKISNPERLLALTNGLGYTNRNSYSVQMNGTAVPLASYPIGSYYTGSNNGSTQCRGFSWLVYQVCWGSYSYGTTRLTGVTATNATVLYNYAAMYGKGSRFNFNSPTYHSMIITQTFSMTVGGTLTYYIDVYHANWGNDNKVYVTRFTKEQFYSYFQVFQSVQDPS